jgi:hypothetical protein
MAALAYDLSVFINCPFDKRYKNLFEAIVFTIYDCGFEARSALEEDDSSANRLDKIFELIGSSKLGIHDISRTQPDPKNRLPGFNMPLELGMFLAAKKYGQGMQKRKRCLVFDTEPHRYQKFISDISGQDIKAHRNNVETTIKHVRDWLNNDKPKGIMMPGQRLIFSRYKGFRKSLPKAIRESGLDDRDIQFNDFSILASEWISLNPK